MSQTIVDALGGSPLFKEVARESHIGPVTEELEKKVVAIMGWPGSGKTSLLRSMPNTWIWDVDKATKDLPPIVHPESSMYTVIRSWEQVKKYLDLLEEAAKQGKRPFKAVAIDTTDGLFGSQASLLAEYAIKAENTDFISAFGSNGAGWGRQIEGAWQCVNRIINAGYGLWMTCHLRRKLVERPDGTSQTIVTGDLTPKVSRIVMGSATYVVVTAKSIGTVTHETEKKLTTGATTVIKERIRKPIYTMIFRSKDQSMEEQLKSRINVGDEIVFDRDNGFALFEKAYNDALGIKNEGDKSE
jgi:hypothetical protein